MRTLAGFLVDAYRRRPDQAAITLQHPDQPDVPVTFRELLERAHDYAAAYAAAGVKPGDVVVLILPHGREVVYSFWAAILLGAIPTIMPFLTEKLSPERYGASMRVLFSLCRPAAVITYPEFEAAGLKMAAESGRALKVLVANRIPAQARPDLAAFPGLARRDDEIALLQHSSGSTGLQKGVALSHRAIFHSLDAWAEFMEMTPRDVFVSWAPLYHDMGLIASFLLPILNDVHAVLMSPFDWVREPWRLLRSLSDYRGTMTILPNFAFNFCANKIRERDLEGVDLSSWRLSINGSEPVKSLSHRLFYERFRSYGLRSDIFKTAYGMAENVLIATQTGMDEEPTVEDVDAETYLSEHVARPARSGRASLPMMSSGRPLRHVSIRVVDGSGRELPERHVGEIVLKSDCMLTEYYHRPDLTQEAFFPGGWYRSGDFGYLAGGEIFVSGRINDMIIVGGKNVYPEDLEALAGEVAGVHPGRTASFGLYEESQGTEIVILLIEVDAEDPEEQDRIADRVRDHVTMNSAVALRRVQVVPRQWILKTSSGKVARAANKEKYLRELAAG